MATVKLLLVFEGTENEKLMHKMENEYLNMYNMYSEISNDGLLENLNKKWTKDNGDGNLYDDPKLYDKYNKYMAAHLQVVVNGLSNAYRNGILDYVIDQDNINLIGYLKWDPEVSIHFVLDETILETEEKHDEFK